jgi:hypothetical protein
MLLTQDFEQRAPVPITFICFEKTYSCNLQCVYVIFFFCKTRNEKEKGKKKLKFGGMDGWMGGGWGEEDTLALWSQIALMYFQ